MSEQRRRRKADGAGNTTSWYPALAVFALVVALLAVSNAVAVSEICGDGIDNDASGGDVNCPAPDADRDNYWTNGNGPNVGTDCDDSNRYIYPGIATSSGCSAGEYRTCQANGTFTSCAAVSGFTCHSGGGSTIWIADSVSTCAVSNAYASPSNMRCFSDTTMSNYRSPVAGDCYVFKTAGSYTDSWTDGGSNVRMIYVTGKDCTSSDKCKIMAAPGTAWWETGATAGVYFPTTAGVRSTGEVEIVEFDNSDYWEVSNLEINGAAGFSNAGIAWSGSQTGGRANNNRIYNIRGAAGSNNISGLKARGGSHSLEWDHNVVFDTYDDLDATERLNQNTSNYLHMDNDEFYVHDNISYQTSADPFRGYGIKIKHPINSSTPSGRIEHNIVYNANYAGISVGGHANTNVERNYLELVARRNSGTAIEFVNLGDSDLEYSGFTVEYNTIVNSPFLAMFDSNHTIGSNLATVRYNVVTDDRGSAYPSDGTDGLIRIGDYGSDAQYTSVTSPGVLVIDYNCYYNTSAVAFRFALFSQTSGGFGPAGASGSSYASFAAWQAAYDANSFSENPTLDSYGRATSTNCDDKGWLLTSEEGGATGGGTACILMRTR